MEIEDMEKVSVIIPTYNRCDKLRKSIDSVLNQTYLNIELVIVDDGSEDDTETMVRSVSDERIRYIKLEKNMGVANARNEGVRYASAELIAFHDSDDLWRPDKLEKQMAYWKEHPEYAMIYCAYMYHNEQRGICERFPHEDRLGVEGDIFSYLLLKNTVGAPTMLFRKQCFEEVGGFNIKCKCLEDWEFALRFAEQYLIGYVNEVLIDVYFTEGSVSTLKAGYAETRCYIIARYKQYLLNNNMFDMVVGDFFKKAARAGVLESVKQLLQVYLLSDIEA